MTLFNFIQSTFAATLYLMYILNYMYINLMHGDKREYLTLSNNILQPDI